MLIALIVILVLVSNCHTDTPEPEPCLSVLCGTACGDPSPLSSCAPCSGRMIDLSSCPPTRPDAGLDGDVVFPGDASCDSTPCFAPVECVFTCEDAAAHYTGCCACPDGSFDRAEYCAVVPPDDAGVDAGPMGLLTIGEACFDDRQCESGLCYGEVDASGAFGWPTCQASCLAPSTTASYCTNDRHCCEGTCCIGCGEREGLCLVDAPAMAVPPPAP